MQGSTDLPYHAEVVSVLEPLANLPLGERIRNDRGSQLMMGAYPDEILAYVDRHAAALQPLAFSRAIERLEPSEKERLRRLRKG